MNRKKTSRRALRALCAEVHPEDGIDPREAERAGSRKPGRRKARQLCGQVAEALGSALAQCGDDVLQGLHVVAVEPAPDASRLLVTVGAPPAEDWAPGLVLGRLDRASARLRCEVAAAITRRRAPTLAFRYAIPAPVGRDGST